MRIRAMSEARTRAKKVRPSLREATANGGRHDPIKSGERLEPGSIEVILQKEEPLPVAERAQGVAKSGLELRARRLLQVRHNASALTGMGEARLLLGEPAPAIPLLERALSLIEEHRGTPALHAEARFQLARALWDAGKERDRAKTLSAEAEEGFVALGLERDAARARAWRKSRGGS
jgi:hypothetical protein